MSMVWLWNRVFGEPRRIEREARAEKQTREPVREADGGPPPLTCRVCHYEGPERYCPECLADTMTAVRKRR